MSEQNILSVAFLPTQLDDLTLGILYLDAQQRPQLTSRDLDINDHELSPPPSIYLPTAALPATSIPISDNRPILVPISEPNAGLIVLGCDDINFYHIVQANQKGKPVGKNLSPTKERGNKNQPKRRKPNSTIKWPWDEITAYETSSPLFTLF